MWLHLKYRGIKPLRQRPEDAHAPCDQETTPPDNPTANTLCSAPFPPRCSPNSEEFAPAAHPGPPGGPHTNRGKHIVSLATAGGVFTRWLMFSLHFEDFESVYRFAEPAAHPVWTRTGEHGLSEWSPYRFACLGLEFGEGRGSPRCVHQGVSRGDLAGSPG